jgi:hypothetical protein
MTRSLAFPLVLCSVLAPAQTPAQTMDMQAIDQALGVRCDYCHSREGGPAEQK